MSADLSADDRYEQQNDQAGDAPAGNPINNDYKIRSGQTGGIPVQGDEAPVNDPIDPATADSDKTLGEQSPYPTDLTEVC